MFLGLEVKSEEQTNLTVLEGRFDWRQIVEGDIGVCGIAVLGNFSCGISVILI